MPDCARCQNTENTHTHTNRQTKFSNPCACAPRVNNTDYSTVINIIDYSTVINIIDYSIVISTIDYSTVISTIVNNIDYSTVVDMQYKIYRCTALYYSALIDILLY